MRASTRAVLERQPSPGGCLGAGDSSGIWDKGHRSGLGIASLCPAHCGLWNEMPWNSPPCPSGLLTSPQFLGPVFHGHPLVI